MRDWSLAAGDPLSLAFAADARLSQPDYLDDHIWELELGAGEPAALSVRTTYGLRARSLRLFYSFAEDGRAVVTDPAAFPQAPRLRRFHPNFLQLSFVPLDRLEVTAEYWVPESHVLAGRLTLVNRRPAARQLDFELCGALTPLDGKSLAQKQLQMVNVLAGRTGGLSPVLFLTGGAKHGPASYPSLAVNLSFDPGSSRTLAWALAALSKPEASFDLARRTAARSWDAERAKIELLEAGDVLDIYTGDPDWDAVLAFSQKAALGLFFPAGGQLPQPSFVRLRQPDAGYSRTGDGLDYGPSWGGASAFDSYYLAGLLPAASRFKRGLLENFFSVQSEDGSIDARPGRAGQRSRFLAPPMLGSLAWHYYLETLDQSFLAESFPKLLAFFEAWFSPAHDRDGDGLPEWDHVLQTGFDDNPLFDLWHSWSQGLDISSLFNPELEALLYREATSLILMAEKLGRDADLSELHRRAAGLRASSAAAWNSRRSLYGYRDWLTGTSLSGKIIGRHKGSGELRFPKRNFQEPARLLIQVQTRAARRPVVEIAGISITPPMARGVLGGAGGGRTERIEEGQFQRQDGGLVATSQKLYGTVERVTIEGLEEKDKVVIRTVDTTGEDITLFAPLWAHLPDPEQARAMVARFLQSRSEWQSDLQYDTPESDSFDRPFGIPALPLAPAPARAGLRESAEAEAVAMGVHLPWNQLIAEGLLAYGFRPEAARLTTRMLSAVIRCLKQNRAFYERYHAQTAAGLGERGALTGFAPVGLFLQTLGVQILSPTRVRLEGKNPFPWPVTILYKGLKVVRGLESTEVVFHNGKSVTVSDATPCEVSL